MVRVSEPGSIIMNCPYCGRVLCADKVDFVSTNVILRCRNTLPISVVEGLTKRRLRTWCNECGVSILIEKVATPESEDEE